MKLLSLELVNFKTHEHTNITFPSLGSPVLIKGVNKDREGFNASNGAGKSSIFDAIDYALFNKARDFLRHGTQAGSVVLEFEHYGCVYKIKKDFDAAGHAVCIFKDGTLVSDQKSETERIIRSVIKISRPMFEQTIYQSQGFSGFFGLLSPKLKSQYVMELLEIDKWEEYYEIARVLLNALTDQGTKIKMQCEVLQLQIDASIAALAEKNEESLKTRTALKIRALAERKLTLANYNQIILLQAQKEPLEARRRVVSGSLSTIKVELQTTQAKFEKYLRIETDLVVKNIVPIDDNYKQHMMTNALAFEKQLAAREQELRSKSAEIEKFDKMRTSILAQSICPFCRRAMTEGGYQQQLEQHLLGERTALRAEYDSLMTTVNNLYQQRNSAAQQLEALNAQVAVYTEHIQSLATTRVQIEAFRGQITLLTQQKESTSLELKTLDSQLQVINAALVATDITQIRTLELDIQTLETEVAALNAALAEIAALQSRIATDRAQLAMYTAEYGQTKRQINRLRHVAAIFSNNGIQKWLFVRALDKISTLANALIRPVGFSLVFQLEKTKKSGEGFKPAFDILVTKNAEKRVLNLEDLSGAEKALIHFSIRLAFSTIAASNHDIQFMIIDEGFGDLDASNREYLASIIKHLAQQYQIFLVTHFQDFENEFHNIMLVERSGGVSRIRQGGA